MSPGRGGTRMLFQSLASLECVKPVSVASFLSFNPQYGWWFLNLLVSRYIESGDFCFFQYGKHGCIDSPRPFPECGQNSSLDSKCWLHFLWHALQRFPLPYLVLQDKGELALRDLQELFSLCLTGLGGSWWCCKALTGIPEVYWWQKVPYIYCSET